jgi:NAD(P)H-flavin reductase
MTENQTQAGALGPPLAASGPQFATAFRRIASHPWLIQYHRLVALVAVLNLWQLATGLAESGWWWDAAHRLQSLSHLVLANFAVAVLVRQQYVVKLLFWLATRAPTSWPLAVRWQLAKVFHFGGLHSGCATVATLWFGLFTAAVFQQAWRGLPGVSAALVGVSVVLVGLLAAMVMTALPKFRARFHNQFELAHRFGGWVALLLFWTHAFLFIDAQRGSTPFAEALWASPAPWVLVGICISIALPWMRLRRVRVETVKPSSHAVVVRFNHGETPFPGSSTAISRHPLVEWHSFANIPTPGEEGFRLIISRAGDWTGRFIDDTPRHVWVKGITTAGVANIETLFRKVVYVATGSGIGPVLPHLLAQRVPMRLIWSTRSPRKTYGDALVEEILAAQPDSLIWDTDARGKPDLVRLALTALRESGAEAVICIANQKLTKDVIQQMERRGIPAYGAIWDS